MEQSETSDNRPHITNFILLPPNTNVIQENIDDDETVIHHQPTISQNPAQTIEIPTESLQDDENLVYDQTVTPHQPSQTTQDTTESLQDTLTNQPNTSTIADSNVLQIPTHIITENTNVQKIPLYYQQRILLLHNHPKDTK